MTASPSQSCNIKRQGSRKSLVFRVRQQSLMLLETLVYEFWKRLVAAVQLCPRPRCSDGPIPETVAFLAVTLRCHLC